MATMGKVDIIVGESVIEWKIRDFFSLPAKVNTEYRSPPFSFANISWRLNIFPNGEKKGNSVGYIDLYLERESLGRPISLSFSFGLKTRDEKIHEEVDFAYVFKKPDSYGCNEFLSRSELFKRRLELAPFDVLTVVCKLKYSGQTDMTSLGNAVTPKCSFCDATLQAHEDIASHAEKCLDKPIKCPECADVMALKKWYYHKCPVSGLGAGVAAKCSFCKVTLRAHEDISTHEEKCLDKPIKCPECADVVALKNWYDHKCPVSGLGAEVAAKCSFCKVTLRAHEDISSHEKKCLDKPIKCPECADVVALKNWYDHKCPVSGLGAEGKTSTTECPNCKENLDAENISWHEILCPGKPIKVPATSDSNTTLNIDDSEFQMVNKKGSTATEMCSYCKKLFDADGILMHEKVCMDKPIKCQECCDMVTLRSMYDHKCQMERTKDEQSSSKQSETADVPSHESTCKSMKCPRCSVTIDSEKWKDHKNLMEKAEAIEKLLNDLKRLMLSGNHSDTTVRVKEEEFRLHKCILSVRNPFFDMMFKNENGEKTADTVHITDCEPDQFRSLTHYIYTGTADKLSPENVCDLYEVADLYQEEQLKAECLQLLRNTVSVDNFCDVIVLALKHNEQELLKFATEFFATKAKEIVRNVKWKSFFKSYPGQADELYMKALECDTT